MAAGGGQVVAERAEIWLLTKFKIGYYGTNPSIRIFVLLRTAIPVPLPMHSRPHSLKECGSGSTEC